MAKLHTLSAVVLALFLAAGAAPAAQSPDTVPAEGGDIVITPILHASVQVEHAGTVVYVDPWSVADLSRARPADLILVTDDPSHHLDPVAIEQLRKPGAPVVLTAKAHESFPHGTVLANGERGTFAGVPVEAVAAHDMTPGQPWHPPGEANGYVVTLGGQRIFFSGVGECVPGNPGSAGHPRGVHAHEPAARPDAAAAGRGMPQDLPAQGGLPVPLRQRVRPLVCQPRPGAAGQRPGDRRDDPGAAQTPWRASRSSCATPTGISGASPQRVSAAGFGQAALAGAVVFVP